MKYICAFCNFKTDRLFCFNQHKNTKKHKEKVKELANITQIKHVSNIGKNHDFICQFCGNQFYNAGSLTRHTNNCSKKTQLIENYDNKLREKDQIINKLTEQNNSLKQLFEQKDNQIDTLKEEIKYLKTIINNTGSIIKSSVSAISYVSQHNTDAPALEAIDDYSKLTYDIDSESNQTDNTEPKEKTDDEIRKDKDKFINTIVVKHEKNILDRYLGDIIIKCYKKKDPKEQSLWSSDTSRLTYVIRELFANKKIDWTVDKKGVKTRNYIVKPLLEHVEKLMKEYITEYSVFDKDELDMREYEPKLRRMNKLGEIMAAIDNGTLPENIVSYVAPEFFLKKENDVPKLKE